MNPNQKRLRKLLDRARELAGIKRRTSFSLVVAAEHRTSAGEKGEMTLQGEISLSFSVRFR